MSYRAKKIKSKAPRGGSAIKNYRAAGEKEVRARHAREKQARRDRRLNRR